jgi:CubicO group peptidase (beta-lactamase class C family)
MWNFICVGGKSMRFACVLVAVLYLSSVSFGGPTEQVEAYVKSQLTKRHIPGMSVAVVYKGRIVLARGYGFANVELSVPATAETVYMIGSITKHFTAAGLMLLVEDGRIALDDTITSYLPDIPSVPAQVTVRHLLTHTSGIIDHTEIPGSVAFARQDRLPREVVKDALARPLQFKPGEQFSYSNTNYFLLGMIIERINRSSFGPYLTKRIFGPLQMKATRMNNRRAIIGQRASGYNWTGQTLVNAGYVSPSNLWSSGGIVSTVQDLALWEHALASHTILKKATLQEMLEPARLSNGQEVKYGLGNELEDQQGHHVAGHAGEVFGFSSAFARYVDDALCVIVLCNLGDAPAEVFAERIAAIYLGLPITSYENNKGIEDKEPKITEMVRRILDAAREGKVDQALFTAPAQRELVPTIRRAGRELLGSKGALKSLVLLERKEIRGKHIFVYRAVFAQDTLIWTLELDDQGKIAKLEPKPE